MKKIIFIVFIVPLLLFGQELADKEFYLIDSLNLAVLTENDRAILDSSLTIYSLAKDDTAQIAALTFICDNLVNEVWSDYQFVQYQLIFFQGIDLYPIFLNLL